VTTGPTTIAWFNAGHAGIAGDMALGALLDAGADLDEVRAIVATLGLPAEAWSLDVERTARAGVATTRALVAAPAGPDAHVHRPWRDIRALLDGADLPGRVAARATAVFTALAEAEAAVHGVAPDDVEFHEVGAVDAIVDVVGTCAALEVLGVDEVRCSAVAQGSGTTRSGHGDHGVLPVPAPAVVRLLAAVGAPVVGVDLDVELTTPTGAAIVAALAGKEGFGPLPAMTLRATGFGAGARELPGRPNATQVVIGRAVDQDETGGAGGPGLAATVVEANVDDITGEVLAHTIAALLAAGAHDAWVTPIVMKKGRPAYTVTALVDPADVAAIAAVLTAETGSLGVRATPAAKWPAVRSEATVDVGGHPVRVKLAGGRVKVEHDDALAAAEALGMPLREVLVRAEAAGLGLGSG
jgi:uncharacterized protein (TIGR00299 family) protein